MRTLNIDIETYSATNLKTSGVYKYVEDPTFTILLFAYSFDDEEKIRIVELENMQTQFGELDSYEREELEELRGWLLDPTILKTAHNAGFERTCLAKFFNIKLNPAQWSCTMVRAAMMGLPLGLEFAAKALKIEQQKLTTGKALIKYFCVPCKPTKTNGMRTRNMFYHDPERWAEFKRYCIGDVAAERAIRKRVIPFGILPVEVALWNLDQKINDVGLYVDEVLIDAALEMDAINRQRLIAEAIEITGVANPNSATQLRNWLQKELEDNSINTLRKDDIPILQKAATGRLNEKEIKRVLDIRAEISKSSIRKYTSLKKYRCKDGRVRGLLQYYAANRTGRWGGRGVQPHNLRKNNLKDLALARKLVRLGDIEAVAMAFGSVADTLSQLIRTAFIASPVFRLIPGDFSAIEARVISWLAGEQWRLDVFKTHGRIYEASASQMFKVALESISYIDAAGKTVKGVNFDMRSKGKVAELALGFQGGVAALIAMGALKMGIVDKAVDAAKTFWDNNPKKMIYDETNKIFIKTWPEYKEFIIIQELQKLVNAWREANPNIKKLWRTVGNAAITAVESGQPVTICYGIRFHVEKNILFITLPSKRKLAYIRPILRPGKFDKPVLWYEGLDDNKRWARIPTYGGKLVENIVQAIARDCMGDAMLRVDKAGYEIVLHVHDEIVPDVPNDSAGSTEDLNRIMSQPIAWAPGLPLNADSYETLYYKKDD